MKRLQASISSGGYGEFAFNYDSNNQSNTQQQMSHLPPTNEAPQEEEKPFLAPPSLALPSDMEIPATDKTHKIIERTALFVSKQGAQMEIVLKAKQANNTQFNFLQFDHYLNPYYKHMVKRMKEGKYVVGNDEENKSEDEEDSDSDSDGGYLHPSLFASSARKPAQEEAKKEIKPIQQIDPEHPLAQLIQKGRRANAIKQIHNMNAMVDAYYFQNSEVKPSEEEFNAAYSKMMEAMRHIVLPPPNLQPVVDNIARQIAEEGEKEEKRLRSSHDGFLEFLDPSSELHPYFVFRKVTCIQQLELMKRQQMEMQVAAQKAREEEMEKERLLAEEEERKRIEEEEAKKPATISFAIKNQELSSNGTVSRSNPFHVMGEEESDEETKENGVTVSQTIPKQEDSTQVKKPRRRFMEGPPDGVEDESEKEIPPPKVVDSMSFAKAVALSTTAMVTKSQSTFSIVTPSGEKSSITTLREKQAERKQKALLFMMKNKPTSESPIPEEKPVEEPKNIATEDIFDLNEDDDNEEGSTQMKPEEVKPAALTTLKDLLKSRSSTPLSTELNTSPSRSSPKVEEKRSRSRSRSKRRSGSRSRKSRSRSRSRRRSLSNDNLPSSYRRKRRHTRSPSRSPVHSSRRYEDSDSDNVPSAYRHANDHRSSRSDKHSRSHRRRKRSKSRSRDRSHSKERKKHSKKKKSKHKKSSKDKKKRRKKSKEKISSSDGELTPTPPRKQDDDES